MNNKSKAIYTAIKWLFVIAAFAYLAYKLIAFDKYDEFFEQWRQTPASRFWWLAGVFALLPLNWALESFKWMRITAHIQSLSFAQSLKGVLAGITTGFFTPNRIGDLLGRIVFLQPSNRTAGITLSLLNSFTQNLTIILCGIPACMLLFSRNNDMNSGIRTYILIAIALLMACMLFYFLLPALSKKIKHTTWGRKINEFVACLSRYSTRDLAGIIFISMLRYLVFSAQFFFMLCLFDVHLTLWQALLAIPTNYLFVTFTPSVAFSEAALRASYAIFVIGFFSGQTLNIALAGVAIWVVNWVLPLLAGAVLMLRSKE